MVFATVLQSFFRVVSGSELSPGRDDALVPINMPNSPSQHACSRDRLSLPPGATSPNWVFLNDA
jgi:hypothetical protein